MVVGGENDPRDEKPLLRDAQPLRAAVCLKAAGFGVVGFWPCGCLLYTSPSPRDSGESRIPS
ncbi:MAG: hypothetical protein MPK62_11010, partial [Alphaproteobacteria bacterium]|nr:hypothetical protein [Alphaproteobacteria bacterium]